MIFRGGIAGRAAVTGDHSSAAPRYTVTGIWPPQVASGRTGREQARGSVAPLSWCFVWWQVQGSNLGRRSRRFTDHWHIVTHLRQCSEFPIFTTYSPGDLDRHACANDKDALDVIHLLVATDLRR